MNAFFNSYSKVGKFKWELDAKGGGNQEQGPNRVNSVVPVDTNLDPNVNYDFDPFMPEVPNPDFPPMPDVRTLNGDKLITVPS